MILLILFNPVTTIKQILEVFGLKKTGLHRARKNLCNLCSIPNNL